MTKFCTAVEDTLFEKKTIHNQLSNSHSVSMYIYVEFSIWDRQAYTGLYAGYYDYYIYLLFVKCVAKEGRESRYWNLTILMRTQIYEYVPKKSVYNTYSYHWV